MTEFLSDRMGRVERALRDMAHANRQLSSLLLQALQGNTGSGGGSLEPVAREPARHASQSAAETILRSMAGKGEPTTPAPWDRPVEGLGSRLQGYVERKREEAYQSEGPGLRLRFNDDER